LLWSDGETANHICTFRILVIILILVYLLTAIWLTPGGTSTVHIYSYTQTIHRTTQQLWLEGFAGFEPRMVKLIGKNTGRAPSLRVIPWNLPYNWGKSTEKPQSGLKPWRWY